MVITNEDYPLLSFFSKIRESAPDDFPFKFYDHPNSLHENLYMNGLWKFINHIAKMNSKKKGIPGSVYAFSPDLQNKLIFDKVFQIHHYNNLMLHCDENLIGTILLDDHKQFIFRVADKEYTKRKWGKEGRYIAVAMYKRDCAMEFEEAIMGNVTGAYNADERINNLLDVGIPQFAFIEFIMPFISYLSNLDVLPKLLTRGNETAEKIFCIE